MEVVKVDEFVPCYEHACVECGGLPTVEAVVKGERRKVSQLCGVCTWGEEAADPEEWN